MFGGDRLLVIERFGEFNILSMTGQDGRQND